MKIEYGKNSDCAFIWITEKIKSTSNEKMHKDEKGIIANELWPKELKDKIGILFYDKNQLIGLEIMNASSVLESNLISEKT